MLLHYCLAPCLIYLIFFSISFVQTEYYSSIADLSQALLFGKQLATDLETYVNLEEQRLNRLRNVIQRLSTNAASSNVAGSEEILSNPISAYLMLKRLSINWEADLLHLLDGTVGVNTSDHGNQANLTAQQQNLDGLLSRIEDVAHRLPGSDDLSGAAEALLRLQKTYALTAENMANGKLINDLRGPLLSAAQCMHLGRRAFDLNYFEQAEEWFRVAYIRLGEEMQHDAQHELFKDNGMEGFNGEEPEAVNYDFIVPEELRPSAAQVLDHLAYSLGRQERYEEALNITRLILQIDHTDVRSRQNEEFYITHIRMGEGIIGPSSVPPKLSKLEMEQKTYQALCRGDKLFPPPPDSTLYCRYAVPHPYYKIGPVKEEVLYPDPKLVVWYDVIHPNEIEHVKKLAQPHLRRATVKNPVTGQLEFADYRTSKSAWFPYETDQVTQRLSQRIHALTGLSMETAEQLQIGNYGIGGHYAPHFDFGRRRERDAFERAVGNRVATIIFYMSDVKAGGATVFNRIGALVPPTKGAAGFWYNLHPSGEGDLRTRHVACPVLVGSKWVMNVWFHERGQEFIRPCGLKPDPIEVDDGY